jgi:hypothetical protein
MKQSNHSASLGDSITSSTQTRFSVQTRLESRVLGRGAKRHGKRLLIIAVLEISADHLLHYHCIIDRPYYCPLDRFTAIIRDQWPRTDFGYHRVDVQGQSDRGWTDYMLKRRQKDSLLDSMDWANCHLDC